MGTGAAFALGVGGAVAVAPAAHAAVLNVSVNCSTDVQSFLPEVTARPGDTVNFIDASTDPGNACYVGADFLMGTLSGTTYWPGTVSAWGGKGTTGDFTVLVPASGPSVTASTDPSTPMAWVTIAEGATPGPLFDPNLGDVTGVVRFYSSGTGQPYISRITVAAAATPPAEGSDQTPADKMQQVPVPASESCSDVADGDLKWGTQVSGGWAKSWATWANADVCTRTLYYNTSSASWAVR